MNPFEQLRLVSIDPRQAFEDAAINILRATVGNVRRVRVFGGDGGVDGFTGSYGGDGAVEVYQVKYFPDPFGPSQQQQIRDSFKTASNSPDFNLSAWKLCVPSRLTKNDLRWFDEWARNQPVPVSIVDGDDLKELLARDECAPIRRELDKIGVRGLASDGPSLAAKVVVIKPDSASGLEAILGVQLKNIGTKSAAEIRVEIGHSETRCAARYHREAFWLSDPDGELNPRKLRAIRPLNPDEPCPVLDIPIVDATPKPIVLWLKIWAQDCPSIEMHAVVDRADFSPGNAIAFAPGPAPEIETQAAASRPSPASPSAKDLLELILQNEDLETRGVTQIADQDLFGPLEVGFMPHTGRSGNLSSMKKRLFLAAIEELIALGLLAEPESGGNTLVYEYLG